MKQTGSKESPKKVLSAWERRRLYSSQLREKTLLQTPGPRTSLLKGSGTVARTTPTSKKYPGGSGTVSPRGIPKSSPALAARTAGRSPQALKNSPKSSRPGDEPFAAKKTSLKLAITRGRVPAAVKTETFYKKASPASKKPLPSATGSKASMSEKSNQPALKKVHVASKLLGRKSTGKPKPIGKTHKQNPSSSAKSPMVARRLSVGRSPESTQKTKASATGVTLHKQLAPQKVKVARVTVAKTTLSRRSTGKRHPISSAKAARRSLAGKTRGTARTEKIDASLKQASTGEAKAQKKTTPSKRVSGTLFSPTGTSLVTKAKTRPSQSPKISPTARRSAAGKSPGATRGGKVQASPKKLSTSLKSPRSPSGSASSPQERATPASSRRGSKPGSSPTSTTSLVTSAKRQSTQSWAKSKIARLSAAGRTPGSTPGEEVQGSSKRASRGENKPPKKPTPSSKKHEKMDPSPTRASPVARRTSHSPVKSRMGKRSTAGNTPRTVHYEKAQASPRRHSASPTSPQRVSRGDGKPQKKATPTSAKQDSGSDSSQSKPSLVTSVKRRPSQSPAKSKVERRFSAGRPSSTTRDRKVDPSPKGTPGRDSAAQKAAGPSLSTTGASFSGTSPVLSVKRRLSQSPAKSKIARAGKTPSPAASLKAQSSPRRVSKSNSKAQENATSGSPRQSSKAHPSPRGKARSSRSATMSKSARRRTTGRTSRTSRSTKVAGKMPTQRNSELDSKADSASTRTSPATSAETWPSSSPPEPKTGRHSATRDTPSPGKEKKAHESPRRLSKGGSKSSRRATPSTSKQDSKGHPSPTRTSPLTSAKRQPSQSPPKPKTPRHSAARKSPRAAEGTKAQASPTRLSKGNSKSPQRASPSTPKRVSKAHSSLTYASPVTSVETQPSPSPAKTKAAKRSLVARSPNPTKRMKVEASPTRLSKGDGKAPEKATPSTPKHYSKAHSSPTRTSPLTSVKTRPSQSPTKSKAERRSLAAKSPSPTRRVKAVASATRLSKGRAQGKTARSPPKHGGKARTSPTKRLAVSTLKARPSQSPTKSTAARRSLGVKSPSPSKRLEAQKNPRRLSKGGSRSPLRATPSTSKRGSKANSSPTRTSPLTSVKTRPSQSPTKSKAGRHSLAAKSPSPSKKVKAETSPTRLSKGDGTAKEKATPSTSKRGSEAHSSPTRTSPLTSVKTRPSQSPTKSKAGRHSLAEKSPSFSKKVKAETSPRRLSIKKVKAETSPRRLSIKKVKAETSPTRLSNGGGAAKEKATPSTSKCGSEAHSSPTRTSPLTSVKTRPSQSPTKSKAGRHPLVAKSPSPTKKVKAETSPARLSKGDGTAKEKATPSTSKRASEAHSSPARTSLVTSAKRRPSKSPTESKTLRPSAAGKTPRTAKGKKAKPSPTSLSKGEGRAPKKAAPSPPKRDKSTRSSPKKRSPVTSVKGRSSHSLTKTTRSSAPRTSTSTTRDTKAQASPQRPSKEDSLDRESAAPSTLKHGSKMPSSPASASPVSGVKRKASPSPAKAKVVKRAPDVSVASCSTPRAMMAKKTVARSLVAAPRSPDRVILSDSSDGSTPYHTARSMLSVSSGGSTSPVSRSAKRFAGGTPYRPKHSSSYDSAPESPVNKTSPRKSDQKQDASGQSELNDTFTMETESPTLTPKRVRSRPKRPPQLPSSCLRKGTSSSHVKKSVSFTVPGRRSLTPKRLPKTPRRSRTLQESLKDWLSVRGYSLSALRQSSRDNTPVQDKPAKPRRSSGTAIRNVLRSAENQERSASPQQHERRSLLQESTGDKAGPSKHAKISALLADLQASLEEPDPPEDIEDWLNQLEEQVPSVMEHSAFWLCRCLSFEKAGNLNEAVKSLSTGLDSVTSGRKELAAVLESLVKKAAAKEEASPSHPTSKKRGRKPSTGPRKRQKSLEVVSTENMFASTIIDYKVYEKPSAKRQSAALQGKQSLGIAVMTPVRRSSRHSKSSSSPVFSQKLLYKSNSALVDE